MEPIVTLYRGTDAPDVIFEVSGADLSNSAIEMEVRYRRRGGPLTTLSLTVLDGDIEIIDASHIRWRPAR